MSRALTAGEFKALVRQLVAAVGGVEAAAATLGISHQRVSQLQSINCPDQMTFLQVCALEAVAERDIVTGAASRAIKGEEVEAVNAAVVDAVAATADALSAVHMMDADGIRDAGEIRSVQTKADNALRQAQQLVAAAARLTPGAANVA